MLFQKTGNFKLFPGVLLFGFLAFFQGKTGHKINIAVGVSALLASTAFLILCPEASQRIHSGYPPGHLAQYLIPGVSDLPAGITQVR